MSSYVCASLDASGGCAEWAQTWNPAVLSVADGAAIASVVISCWALAYGLKALTRFIINRL